MEREQTRILGTTIGNGLPAAAIILGVVGVAALAILTWNFEDRIFGLGSGSPDFVDYLSFFLNYGVVLTIPVAILVGATGLYFRWLATEQDVRMTEFDMLLDAVGVPAEGEDETPGMAERGIEP